MRDEPTRIVTPRISYLIKILFYFFLYKIFIKIYAHIILCKYHLQKPICVEREMIDL